MSLQHSQNFLHQPALVRRLLDFSSITPHDHVVEIGPGRGIITAALARRCGSVLAIEADARLAASLRRRFADWPRVKILHGDALLTPLPTVPYKVLANPPFNRTADLLRRLLDGSRPPAECCLVLQREAAGKHLGLGRPTLVSVLRWPWYVMQTVYRFDRRDFRPAPGVDCVFVRIVRRPNDPANVAMWHATAYRDFVTRGFTGGRGSLRKNLDGIFGHREFLRLACDHGFDRDTAPSELTRPQWQAIFQRFVHHVDPDRRSHVAGAHAAWLGGQRGLVKRRRHQHGRPGRTKREW
ncbi:MAG: rRNA adenine N(6)-methyltransferase family protein [Planctomycetota bacterium]